MISVRGGQVRRRRRAVSPTRRGGRIADGGRGRFSGRSGSRGMAGTCRVSGPDGRPGDENLRYRQPAGRRTGAGPRSTLGATDRPVRGFSRLGTLLDPEPEPDRLRFEPDLVGVAGDPGVGPDLESGTLRADARESERGRDVHVGGESPRCFARAAVEDLQRRVETVHLDAVLDEIRCAREPAGRLARDHGDRLDTALGRATHRVEPHHRPARHHDLRAGGACGLDEVGVVEQRAGADGDQDLSGPDRRLRNLAKHRGRRALDHDVRAPGQIAGGDDVHRRPESAHPVPRPRAVARRHCGRGSCRRSPRLSMRRATSNPTVPRPPTATVRSAMRRVHSRVPAQARKLHRFASAAGNR